MTDRELQTLRNMGNECEKAADEIERLRYQIEACIAKERERWATITRTHISLERAKGFVEQARVAKSILSEGLLDD